MRRCRGLVVGSDDDQQLISLHIEGAGDVGAAKSGVGYKVAVVCAKQTGPFETAFDVKV